MSAGAITPQEIARAIEACTHEVFATMLGLEIGVEEARDDAHAVASRAGLISLIGLAGAWSGTGSVSCSETLACDLASHLLMTDFESLSEEVVDAMAEITNMIIGNVKTHLEEKVGPMGLSTPTVIYGHDFHARSARAYNWIVVRFRCGDERLFIQMCLAPARDPEKHCTREGLQIPNVLTV